MVRQVYRVESSGVVWFSATAHGVQESRTRDTGFWSLGPGRVAFGSVLRCGLFLVVVFLTTLGYSCLFLAVRAHEYTHSLGLSTPANAQPSATPAAAATSGQSEPSRATTRPCCSPPATAADSTFSTTTPSQPRTAQPTAAPTRSVRPTNYTLYAIRYTQYSMYHAPVGRPLSEYISAAGGTLQRVTVRAGQVGHARGLRPSDYRSHRRLRVRSKVVCIRAVL